jgi:hypothetical protein
MENFAKVWQFLKMLNTEPLCAWAIPLLVYQQELRLMSTQKPIQKCLFCIIHKWKLKSRNNQMSINEWTKNVAYN